MKTCAFITLGCKVNQYETQAIRESLAARGFVEANPEHAADLYVINTCTVTSVSDEKSRQYIKKVRRKNPHTTVVVTGCYAEADAETIKKMEGVDYVITKAEEAHLAEIICRDTVHRVPTQESVYNLKISHFAGHTKAFLKIEDGCDMYCSYCIIPYVRGGIKSRRLQDILEEAKRLIQNGYKEIILTGIHLGAYGRDAQGNHRLLDVIHMLSNLSGLERLRLSSIEVNEITNDLIDLVAHTKKVCPHFHVPLQSGDDNILKRMNRKYTASQYVEVLDNIRSKIDLPSFTTDVMVGFPGEKDVHFENTVELCKKVGFSRMHIFSFSIREGTPAAKMNDQCHPKIIKQRKAMLEATANDIAFAYKKQFSNKVVEVLVEAERDHKTNQLCGYSKRYIKVLFDGSETAKNSIVSVRIEEVNPSFAVGTLQ
ncbi:MAG: tRNA (N(6)-L-threonylcarbamoyladenosine(37)-C(2))-methylthiotransferase MtaB [Planctomycetes bacterium]|uniref:tRNA (N(6)-L-threonylcarbamoyladenosine(37)-C(2))- methylthiotransferase MtaB n=1 Tax=Candidatus Wunengus californicus TaxID=3367619 RepID=UPI004025D94C|nr:tRNA (N(6)-L-threonylcarbamoyladenosine(37)-C(2))-methylthiotransferase MtaB [Planctomycetota bacterium]